VKTLVIRKTFPFQYFAFLFKINNSPQLQVQFQLRACLDLLGVSFIHVGLVSGDRIIEKS
jgi:hypothetical protein